MDSPPFYTHTCGSYLMILYQTISVLAYFVHLCFAFVFFGKARLISLQCPVAWICITEGRRHGYQCLEIFYLCLVSELVSKCSKVIVLSKTHGNHATRVDLHWKIYWSIYIIIAKDLKGRNNVRKIYSQSVLASPWLTNLTYLWSSGSISCILIAGGDKQIYSSFFMLLWFELCSLPGSWSVFGLCLVLLCRTLQRHRCSFPFWTSFIYAWRIEVFQCAFKLDWELEFRLTNGHAIFFEKLLFLRVFLWYCCKA